MAKIVHNAWKSAEREFCSGIQLFANHYLIAIVILVTVPYQQTHVRNPLCPHDSCRLIAINLYSYVENPFTKDAYFNYDLFKQHSMLAQKIMDDIIDLEMEKIDKIIEKIESDPEAEEIKLTEKELWQKIRDKTVKGRRTGVGTTGEGDMLAALGLRYGTEEATSFSENVHKNLALACYRSSVDMAKERGHFDVYDAKREVNNPFVLRIKEADPHYMMIWLNMVVVILLV